MLVDGATAPRASVAANLGGQMCVVHKNVACRLNIYLPCYKLDYNYLTISILQAYSAVITEYAIPSDSVRKSTVPLQIKISTAQLNFSNRNIIIF